MNYRFKQHALHQLTRRTEASTSEIKRLLNESRFVVLQTEGTGVVHALVYAPEHKECLVLICDPRTQEVITVALLALSRPGAKSTTEQRERARKYATGELDPPKRTTEYKIFVDVISKGRPHHFQLINLQKMEPVDLNNITGEKLFVAFLEHRLNQVLGKHDRLCKVEIHYNENTFSFPTKHLTLKDGVIID